VSVINFVSKMPETEQNFWSFPFFPNSQICRDGFWTDHATNLW